jgi:hypothetical protein
VVAAQVHRDLLGPEVVMPPQVDDLADDLNAGGVWRVQRLRRAVSQPGLAELLVAVQPLVEGRPGDPVVPTRRRDVPGHLLGVAKHRQAVPDYALLLSLVHRASPS